MTFAALHFDDVCFRLVTMLVLITLLLQSCFVSVNYKEDEKKCESNPDDFKFTVNLTSYNLPKDTWRCVCESVLILL